MYADPEYYENAKQYLARNSFFFHRAPQEAEALSAEESSTPAEIASQLLADGSVQDAYGMWKHAQDLNASELAGRIRHAAITINTRLSALCREKVTTSSGELSDEHKMAKLLTKQVHDHFRQFLTFGLPSPSTGHVILILGREEVDHRMKRSWK